MIYTLQVFSGSRDAAAATAADVIRRIDAAASRMQVDQVIIGWNTDASLYEKVGAALHERGVRMILWLPVFSEVDEASEPDPAVDVFGKEIVVPAAHGSETFRFVCPSSLRNARIAENVYEESFSRCGFDGVFLDRIRTQSFEAGVSGVLSCGCSRCRKAFMEKGVNLDDVAKLYLEKRGAFFDAASWPMDGRFVAANPLVQRFFDAKEAIIADAVTEITRYFKEKGLIVGLDLFAPAVSRLVGQNYSLITKYADFIKPMLYRRTEAPAGAGYEFQLFEKCAPEARGVPSPAMDEEFLHTQLRAVESVSCEKLPGIEINYNEEIARTDPAYIVESLNAVREHGLNGAALCWNLMQAPEEHIKAIAALGEK